MWKQKMLAMDISPDTNYSPKLKIYNAYIFCLQHRITNASHGSVGTNSYHNSSCPTSNHYCTLAIKICWNLFIANKFLIRRELYTKLWREMETAKNSRKRKWKSFYSPYVIRFQESVHTKRIFCTIMSSTLGI